MTQDRVMEGDETNGKWCSNGWVEGKILNGSEWCLDKEEMERKGGKGKR